MGLKSSYKHIIWDWNGTLFDDAWLCLDIMNQILRKRNLPTMTPDHYQEIFDFPVIDYYQKLGFDFSIEPFEAISTEFILEYERRRSACRLRLGAIAALQSNFKAGLTQSILSASKQDYLHQAVGTFGISGMFNAVIGVDDHHAFGKAEIGRRWISGVAFEPGDILLIGDTIHDYEVATAMEVDCCLVPGGHQNRRRLASCGAKVIESLNSL